MPSSIYVLTGATSGMGLLVAQRLAERTDALLIVGARDPRSARALRTAVPGERLSVLPLDVSRLGSVRDFAGAIEKQLGSGDRLAGIVCSAGLQLLGPARRTEDGFDESFAVNYLGHFALVNALMNLLAPGAIVVTVGSGTHNPMDRLAKLSGFRGADFPNPEAVALGQTTRSGDTKLLGMDRYATGKLCAILHAAEFARRVPQDRVRFYSFDPGLMPGTSLARDRGVGERFAWRYILPAFRFFMSGISTPKKSSYALVDRLILAQSPHPSGSYVEFTGHIAPTGPLATRRDFGAALYDYSTELLSERPERNKATT